MSTPRQHGAHEASAGPMNDNNTPAVLTGAIRLECKPNNKQLDVVSQLIRARTLTLAEPALAHRGEKIAPVTLHGPVGGK